MVGIFSRFSSSRNGHRRTQSSLDQRSEPPSLAGEDASAVTGAAFAEGHGIEVAVEFKPIEHPTEPLDSDQPFNVHCPSPQYSMMDEYGRSEYVQEKERPNCQLWKKQNRIHLNQNKYPLNLLDHGLTA